MKQSKKRKNQTGQTMTEFLFIIVLLISIVFIHTQFSLSYVVASFLRYTSFMAARTEAVNPGRSGIYIEAMIGNAGQQKLSPIATVEIADGGYVTSDRVTSDQNTEQIEIAYQVLSYIPFMDELANNLIRRSSTSVIVREPVNDLIGLPGYRFDNE